jgi:hypothetical protein
MEMQVADPTITDPDKHKVIFENDRVRVLEYRDQPGEATQPHEHPDSVMYTLSAFAADQHGTSACGRSSPFKAAVFGAIGMEQLWNRGGATGGKGSTHRRPENGLN